MKRLLLALSLICFFIGFFLIGPRITGAVIGAADYASQDIIGFLFIAWAVIIFIFDASIDEHLAVTSEIDKDKSLVRLAEKATENQAVQREVNHLTEELLKGNLEAGLGHPGHVEGTSIFYLRGRNGGRLYYRQAADGYEIVAKSAKGENQSQVMRKIQELYHE